MMFWKNRSQPFLAKLAVEKHPDFSSPAVVFIRIGTDINEWRRLDNDFNTSVAQPDWGSFATSEAL